MQIYLARDNQQAGPYTLEQLNAMLASSEVLLTDLMWHEGMNQWQTVGQMTNNQLFYRMDTNNHHTPIEQANPQHNNQESRVTVEQLYGKKSVEQPTEEQPVERKVKTVNLRENILEQQRAEALSKPASVSKRILAVLLDQIIMIVALMPILMHAGIEVLSETMTPTHAQNIVDHVPNHILLMSTLMILAVLLIQTLMLIKKGQSLGKMVVGLRILDKESLRIPSVTNILLIRTVLTNIAYSIPMIGMLLLVVDFVTMVIDKQKQSLHDKMAKTVVMLADDSQLTDKSP